MRAATAGIASLALLACTALSSPSLDPDSEGGSGGEPSANGGSAGAAGAAEAGAAGSAGSGGSDSSGGSAGASGAGGTTGLPEFPWQPSARSGIPSAPRSNVARPTGSPGNLRVLDWAGFRGAMSYTFDDGNSSQITHYDDLNALRVRFSFYLVSSWAGASDPVWARALADGHEIGNHTASHLEQGSALAADTDTGEAFIENALGSVVYTMAAPYGAATYAEIASTRYLINRGAADGLMAPSDETDPFNLHCFLPPADAALTLLDTKVDLARAAGAWQIQLVHGFSDGSDGAFQPIGFDTFVSSVQRAKALGDMWLDSVVNIGAYWVAQKRLAAVTPSTEGDVMLWTWTLPENFPPGKYLRVVVDGGTPSQGGVPLIWDPHGYYEIALDAGSLSLAP
jgi:peptidoglycan/xylan/chitin deacetylase (PgdA/CDA1 family)